MQDHEPRLKRYRAFFKPQSDVTQINSQPQNVQIKLVDNEERKIEESLNEESQDEEYYQ